MEYILSAKESVFTPYYSRWNANTYIRKQAFCEKPCVGNAGSTAGAPVVLGSGFLAGFTKESAGTFEWDGSQLKCEAPQDVLFISDAENDVKQWTDYHRALGIKFRKAPFGLLPEYCTWVEQAWLSRTKEFHDVMGSLTSELIFSYLDTISQMKWTPGRFTIDCGWSPVDGEGGFGDWTPRADLDMSALASTIRAAGHVPGLWMAPALIDIGSLAAKKNPELIGSAVQMDGECIWTKFFYLAPSKASQELINELFQQAFDWGFRKFKLDIFYGPKPVMYEISRQCRKAADRLSEPVELEGHIADPFCAQYMDVIRINDLLISKRNPRWREVFDGHLYVCRNSAPGMVLNLDHVGGNCIDVTEAEFLEHVQCLQSNFNVGYPVLSLLPHHISPAAVAATSQMLI